MQLINITGIARHYGVSIPTVYELIKQPDFPPPLPGFKTRRWNAEDIKNYFNQARS